MTVYRMSIAGEDDDFSLGTVGALDSELLSLHCCFSMAGLQSSAVARSAYGHDAVIGGSQFWQMGWCGWYVRTTDIW